MPNDVGFENFDWRSVTAVRESWKASASATASRPTSPGASTSTPATLIARGIGTPVSHAQPQ